MTGPKGNKYGKAPAGVDHKSGTFNSQ